MSHTIVEASEIEAKNGVFRPLRQPLGVSAFGINQIELPPNAEGPEHNHAEDGQEEVYVVVRGGGKIRAEGHEHELKTGQYVFLSADTTRQMIAGPEGIAWVGVGCQPGAYKPQG